MENTKGRGNLTTYTECEDQLKPCPFCGAKAFLWPIIGGSIKVSCTKDCVTIPSRFDVGFTSPELAVEYWNKRAKEERNET